MNKFFTPSALAKAALALVVTLAVGGACQAQWIKKLSDLDPTNPKGAVSKSLRDLDGKRLDAMQGKEYTFTLRNPNRNGVHFSVHGKPYLVMGGQRITIRGRGTPEVKFDIGGGDGTYKIYTLGSGRTYVFRWKRQEVPEVGPVNLLDLYAE